MPVTHSPIEKAGRATRVKRVFMTTDAVGGVWTYSLDFARGLAAQGIEVELAVIGPHPSAVQLDAAQSVEGLFVASTGLPLDWTAVDRLEVAETAAELRAMARRSGADVVHLHAPALAGRQRWSLPLVVSLHSCVGTWWSAVQSGPLPPDLQWRAVATHAGLAIADVIVAPTRALASSATRFYGLRRAPVVVQNGLAMPSSDGIVGRSGVIFTAGRLWDAGKNLGVLDAAAAMLPHRVVAAGPTVGPNGDRFSAQHLELAGLLNAPDLAVALEAAAVFTSPALYEPFGLAVLEAAQRATPLVLADIDSFRELWDGAAVFVPPRDARALAMALARLMDSEDERKRFGEQARRRARRYSSASLIASMLAVYERVLAHPDMPRGHSTVEAR